MNKKASANMWWIIIGAVIALVVMIVLMTIFSGKTTDLETGLSACESKGGTCVADNEKCPQSTLKSSTFSCSTRAEKCCIGVPKTCEDDANCGKGQCKSFGDGKFYCV